MLIGPEALVELREDMTLAVSFLSVGCKNIGSSHCYLQDRLKHVYVCIICFFVGSAVEAK